MENFWKIERLNLLVDAYLVLCTEHDNMRWNSMRDDTEVTPEKLTAKELEIEEAYNAIKEFSAEL